MGKKPQFFFSPPSQQRCAISTPSCPEARSPRARGPCHRQGELRAPSRDTAAPRCQVQVQVVTVLLTRWVCTSGSHGPFLRFCHLLERLAELRKTVYSLGDGFIIKGHDSGAAELERRMGQGMREGTRIPLTRPLQRFLIVSQNLEAPLGVFFFFFLNDGFVM